MNKYRENKQSSEFFLFFFLRCSLFEFFYKGKSKKNNNQIGCENIYKQMKKFFKLLFSDDNNINEKSIVGFISFGMILITLILDLITGMMGKKLEIHQFIFDGFLIITLGSLGIASVDKWITRKTPTKTDDEDENNDEIIN